MSVTVEPQTNEIVIDKNTSGSIPMNTGLMKGDLLVCQEEGYIKRLPVGNNDQVLTADSASELGVKWSDANSSSTKPADHNHDDRYYTEWEMDIYLAGKSDKGHTHDSRYYTESEVESLLAGKSDKGHTHDSRYYTKSEANNLLAAMANNSGAGYCKMPDGTLIQWGSASITRSVGINESSAITFPIPYLSTTSPLVFTTFNTRAYSPYLSSNPSDVFYNEFKIVLVNSNATAYSDGTVNWLAVGRWK